MRVSETEDDLASRSETEGAGVALGVIFGSRINSSFQEQTKLAQVLRKMASSKMETLTVD